MIRIGFAAVLIAVVTLSSCNREEVGPDASPITEVSEIAPLVNAFIEAGRSRGVSIPDDLGGITLEISSIRGNSTLGYCSYDPNRPGHIVLAEDYWRGANTTDEQRVVLLFHELGHCFLNRDHYDNVLGNGLCKSIMHTDESDCEVGYNDEPKRYLDELFSTGIVM